MNVHKGLRIGRATTRSEGHDLLSAAQGILICCRAPPGAESADFSVGPPAGDSEQAAVAWDAYWGYDCAAQRGLCDAVYKHLGITESSWQALKMLPSVSANRPAIQLSKILGKYGLPVTYSNKQSSKSLCALCFAMRQCSIYEW